MLEKRTLDFRINNNFMYVRMQRSFHEQNSISFFKISETLLFLLPTSYEFESLKEKCLRSQQLTASYKAEPVVQWIAQLLVNQEVGVQSPAQHNPFFLFYEKIQILMRKAKGRAVFQISLYLKRCSIQETISSCLIRTLLVI